MYLPDAAKIPQYQGKPFCKYHKGILIKNNLIVSIIYHTQLIWIPTKIHAMVYFVAYQWLLLGIIMLRGCSQTTLTRKSG